jgi:hypothetical protein
MSSTALRVFCLYIVFGLSLSWPAFAHTASPQRRVSHPSSTPYRSNPGSDLPLPSSELFEQQQEKRLLQQLQWQQQQEEWRYRQDLMFQQQYSQQQQELQRQQEIRLRAQ